MNKCCPRCRSENPAEANRVPGLGWQYRCRDPWHMPSLTVEQQEAIEFAKAVDEQFSGDPCVPEKLLPEAVL
jgi:hypothetical protein